MFHILGQLLVGLIIGAIARLLIPGKEPIVSGLLGWLVTALIGMGGAFVGTFIGQAVFGKEKYAAGWIMSVFGAVILLVVVRILF